MKNIIRLIINAMTIASILGVGLSVSAAPDIQQEPAESDGTLFWWVTNDGREVRVPAAFYYPALAVVDCETGGTWDAHAVGRLGEASWFQLHPIHAWRFHRRGWSWESAWDPGRNTEIALEIWQERGWQPWSCAR